MEAPIETIDAVDTDALLLPAAHISAPLDNTELQRRKLDVINSMKALNEMEEAETKFTVSPAGPFTHNPVHMPNTLGDYHRLRTKKR